MNSYKINFENQPNKNLKLWIHTRLILNTSQNKIELLLTMNIYISSDLNHLHWLGIDWSCLCVFVLITKRRLHWYSVGSLEEAEKSCFIKTCSVTSIPEIEKGTIIHILDKYSYISPPPRAPGPKGDLNSFNT